MERKLRRAFDQLTPREQILVGGIIISLHNKDVALSKMAKEVHEFLDKNKGEKEEGDGG